MKRVFTFLILLNFLNSAAQDSTTVKEDTRWQMLKYDVANMFTSVGYSYARPVHWKGKQWAEFGAIAAGTAFVYLFDNQTSEFIRLQREGVPNIIREYGSVLRQPRK